MCGIVGAVTRRRVSGILLEGLQRLEYRGYDSAGLAVFNGDNKVQLLRRVGKVKELKIAGIEAAVEGTVGIAHTRWATHGKPTLANAHPHTSGASVALVHNGIIENHAALRSVLIDRGYVFSSETDTEVIAHLVHYEVASVGGFRAGMQAALEQLEGAYAVAVIHQSCPDTILAARSGSPLVVGLGIDENYVASDPLALRPVTDRFIFLEEGEMIEITADDVSIFGANTASIRSRAVVLTAAEDAVSKGEHRHYMAKEIFQQPDAIRATLAGRVTDKHVLTSAFGVDAEALFAKTKGIQIVACGSSFLTGMVAKYWFEDIADLPCQVEIASEFRYRSVAKNADTLLVTISQSGETADTLAALRNARHYLASLCFCNVPNSSLVRESDMSLMIRAGPEICVASTKAFTTQLADLLLLVIAIARQQGLPEATETELVRALHSVPALMTRVLTKNQALKKLAERFIDKGHALFLGRGTHYPIALEGALKLKEISYIHAEGYAAGELKHGPLALVDDNMPVVAVAPPDDLLAKVESNLMEVRARGGRLVIFGNEQQFTGTDDEDVLPMPGCHPVISPIIYTIPMQLLAYHVAVAKGTDVDQPRNLAKSVTVE